VELSSLIPFTYLGLLGLLALYGIHRLSMVLRFRWGDERDAPRL